MLKLLILIVGLSAFINEAHAYPNFIGKGYHACLTCHYNPFGNGPLNDYGRGVAASALAGRLFVSDSTSDEDLSNRSGFLFSKPDPKSVFKPALDYRGGNINSSLETDDPQEKYVNMQIDATATANWGKQKEYIATFTYSVVPSNSLPAGQADYDVAAGEDLTFSREHYFGYRFSNNSQGIYVGKMDIVYGIRIPNHTAFSRSSTGNDQYAASHGVVYHLGSEKFDLGLQYFLGDFEKVEEARSSGFAGKYEHSVTSNSRLGVSYLNSTNNNDDETSAYALIAKMGIGKGSSLMYEFGQKVNTISSTGLSTTSQYMFLQKHFYVKRGLYILMTYEQFVADTSGAAESHRISPGIQWFPIQRVEIRADLTNSKQYETNVATNDSWAFLGQVHLWF